MRAGALSVALFVMFGCNQTTTGAITSPSPIPSASPTSSAVPCPSASSYGLLIVAGRLEMIGPTGCIRASAGVNAPSVRTCADGLPALLAPPVSASNTRVYFRDGDTRIRSLKDDQQIADVTTVPGSTTTLSFFSVSPDDQRIAVVVEDLAPAETIGLRLYVEDLAGGGHHADIYASTIPKGGGLTLWPMGSAPGRARHGCGTWLLGHPYRFAKRMACGQCPDSNSRGHTPGQRDSLHGWVLAVARRRGLQH